MFIIFKSIMSLEVTHARVKYLKDDIIDVISIDRIVEFKKKKPKDVNDFQKNKIYRAYYEDDKNPPGLIVTILIADLACGLEEAYSLEDEVRPKFSKINDSDRINTSSFSDDNNESEKNIDKTKDMNVIT